MFNKEIYAAQTTNGDAQFTTSGSTIVDFYLFTGTYDYRAQGNPLDCDLFWQALYADHDTTIRSILRARDARGGGKLRKIVHDLFACFENTAKIDKDLANFFAKCVLAKLPELGYWKDVVRFAVTQKPYWYEARKYAVQLMVEYAREGEHKNLLFKYLPVKFAKGGAFIAHGFGFAKEQEWRQFVTPKRSTVETAVCAKDFERIQYGQVPTQAMKLHKRTFMKFDQARYSGFLAELVQRVNAGESVEGMIKSSGNLPPEVIGRIRRGLHLDSYYRMRSSMGKETDSDLSGIAVDIAQWAAKPAMDFKGKNILVLADTSGSMYSGRGSHPFAPIDVALSMAIIASESNTGPFKNMFMGFGTKAYLVDLSDCNTVVEKVRRAVQESYAGSTNLMSGFDAILKAAIASNCPPDQMPDAIVIPSDMQFDASFADAKLGSMYGVTQLSVFEQAKKKYANAGYKLPRVVYWEVNNSPTKPVSAAEGNVVLMSGFSEQYFTMALTNEVNPLNAVLEDLMKPRYDWKLENQVPF